jgi:hypothetical protein
MDSSFTIKPPAGVQRKYTPRDPATGREPAATELDAAKTVAAADHSDSGQRDRRQDHTPPDVIADPESREVINRENDIRSQGGDREHPDQALLRQRAYRPAPPEADETPAAEPHANIKA